MKASPIQLLQLMFKHVKVELDPEHLPADVPNPLTSVFTFDGVGVHSEVGIGEPDPDHEKGTLFFVGLRVVVDNVPDPERLEQKFAPYKVDVAAEGVFLVPKGVEQSGDAEDLAATMLATTLGIPFDAEKDYNARREQYAAELHARYLRPVFRKTKRPLPS